MILTWFSFSDKSPLDGGWDLDEVEEAAVYM